MSSLHSVQAAYSSSAQGAISLFEWEVGLQEEKHLSIKGAASNSIDYTFCQILPIHTEEILESGLNLYMWLGPKQTIFKAINNKGTYGTLPSRDFPMS